MSVSAQPSGDGIQLSFTLLPPDKQSWFVGDLTFTARPPVSDTGGVTTVSRTQNVGNDDDKDATTADLESRIDKLPDNLKKELYAQLQNLGPRKKSFPVKLTVLTEPAKVEDMHHKSPVKVAVQHDLVRRRDNPATKANRENKIELAKKYLREKGA